MASILALQKLEASNTLASVVVAHSNGSSTCVGVSCSSDGCTGTTQSAM
jgi:hypothetical protein